MKSVMVKMAAAMLGWALVSQASAGILFQQDFSSSNTVASYVSATPNSGQWNAISTSGAGTVVSIASGALQYARSGANAGSFSRTTDFTPTPQLVFYKFDLAVTSSSGAQTTAMQWQVGSGFGTGNSAESNANTYAKFGINFTATTGQFIVRDVSGSTNGAGTFSGIQTLYWVMNNTGTAKSYVAPDNSVETLANDTWDLWVGASKQLNDRTVTTAGQTMTDLKFVFTDGTGTVQMDNFLISIPEPASLALLGVGGLLLLRRRA